MVINDKVEKINEILSHLEKIDEVISHLETIYKLEFSDITKKLLLLLKSQMYKKRKSLIQEFDAVIQKKYKRKKPIRKIP